MLKHSQLYSSSQATNAPNRQPTIESRVTNRNNNIIADHNRYGRNIRPTVNNGSDREFLREFRDDPKQVAYSRSDCGADERYFAPVDAIDCGFPNRAAFEQPRDSYKDTDQFQHPDQHAYQFACVADSHDDRNLNNQRFSDHYMRNTSMSDSENRRMNNVPYVLNHQLAAVNHNAYNENWHDASTYAKMRYAYSSNIHGNEPRMRSERFNGTNMNALPSSSDQKVERILSLSKNQINHKDASSRKQVASDEVKDDNSIRIINCFGVDQLKSIVKRRREASSSSSFSAPGSARMNDSQTIAIIFATLNSALVKSEDLCGREFLVRDQTGSVWNCLAYFSDIEWPKGVGRGKQVRLVVQLANTKKDVFYLRVLHIKSVNSLEDKQDMKLHFALARMLAKRGSIGDQSKSVVASGGLAQGLDGLVQHEI